MVDGETRTNGSGPVIEAVSAAAYTIPTDAPESDGTLEWQATTVVVVEVSAAGRCGLGYAYTHAAAAQLIMETLAPVVRMRDAFDISGAWAGMVGAVRNIGRQGIAASAISAVDNALWDLKARLLGVPVAELLGRIRAAIPAYGSGGFTSYDDGRLADQLGGWAADGFRFVKMKVGREPSEDRRRVRIARDAVGPSVELFVDANGAFHPAEALAAATVYADHAVTWFEEPVSSDDLEGLRFVRDRVPAGMAVAAGEYGWGPFALRRLLETGAVDVLQADATRCLGTTGFLMADALCEAFNRPLSAHCAPALHTHLMCASRAGVHLEWFHDHVRIERLLFDGAPRPHRGQLAPDLSRPGFGLELRRADAEPHLVWNSK
jgi:L-alanine-DL-glutamate epimerase-like enolase superfamily enzyme